MDWFLYDNDLRHERVKASTTQEKMRVYLHNWGTVLLFYCTYGKYLHLVMFINKIKVVLFPKFENRWYCLYFFHKDLSFHKGHFSFPRPSFFGTLPRFKEFFSSLRLCPFFESLTSLLKEVGEKTFCITGCYIVFKDIISTYSHFNFLCFSRKKYLKKIKESMKEFHKDRLVWSNIEDCTAQKTKFPIKDFFSKFDTFTDKNSLMKNFIFCAGLI